MKDGPGMPHMKRARGEYTIPFDIGLCWEGDARDDMTFLSAAIRTPQGLKERLKELAVERVLADGRISEEYKTVPDYASGYPWPHKWHIGGARLQWSGDGFSARIGISMGYGAEIEYMITLGEEESAAILSQVREAMRP